MSGNEHLYFKFDEVERNGTKWFQICFNWSGYTTVNAMDEHSLNQTNLRKEDIAKCLYEGMKIIERQNHLINKVRILVTILVSFAGAHVFP